MLQTNLPVITTQSERQLYSKKNLIDLLSTAIINSVIIYNEFHPQKKDKCSLLSAYEQLIKSLLNIHEQGPELSAPSTSSAGTSSSARTKAVQDITCMIFLSCQENEQVEKDVLAVT